MKKILNILFFITISFLFGTNSFSDSKIDKIKNKIKSGEDKIVNKIWGDKDCSQYSTKTFAGLAKYKKCKSGLDPEEEKSIFQSLKLKGKKEKEFDPNKPCHEYSTKTFTGLAMKMKCKKAKKK